ncbi:MAG: sugar transferase [Ignavibacteriaceae bacterium]|jgi:lipopolysaccharide/colanic/teichoic acid biosynthesis glycosyltransferase|nr:sugar transferase [Ignavibacteriaceae bacterium]
MTDKKYFEAKNRIDFILSAVILIAAFPFMLLIAIVLTVILKSFPLIIQERGITEDNQVFNIYKFRTIKINPYNRINSENILFKPDLSQYVPTFCRWLRKTGLDELPQIFNVLKGEMSLVGPRPLTISDLEVLKNKYPQNYNVRNLITVKPGITGLWQVFGDRTKGIKNLVSLDLEYDERASLLLDLKILTATLPLVFRGKHSDAIIQGMTEIGNIKAINNIQALQ